MREIFEFSFRQSKAIFMIIVLMTAGGVAFFFVTPKEAFPPADTRKVTVKAIYPGASPLEIETQVVNKIESAIMKLEGIKNIRSFIKENSGYVVAEIYTEFPKTTEEMRTEIQNELDQIDNFPSNMEDAPIASVVDVQLFPVYNLSVSGGNDLDDLIEFTDIFKESLKEIKEVNSVKIDKIQNKEIWVETTPSVLRERNINISDILMAIRAQNLDLPSGDIKIADVSHLIVAKGQYESLDDIRNTLITMNDYGNAVYVRDVAKVSWNRQDVDYRFYKGGAPALTLEVIKKPDTDIVALVKKVKDVVSTYQNNKKYERFKISGFGDVSLSVQRRLGVLTSNAFSGAILIFFVLLIFFDFMSTIVAALSLPLSFCMAFFVSSVTGNSLNMITMFAFIIVVGMIVDNAILIIENIYVHLMTKPGKTLKTTIINAVADVFMPLVASISTTIAAFIPMLSIKTTVGAMMGYIPPIVTYTIMASFFICVFYLPTVVHWRLKNKLKKSPNFVLKEKALWLKPIEASYERSLDLFIRNSYKFLFVFVVLVGVVIFAFFKFIPKEMFMGELESLVYNVELPKNFNKKMTLDAMSGLEKDIEAELGTNIDSILTVVGKWDGESAAEDDYKNYVGNYKIFVKVVGKTMKDTDFLFKLNDLIQKNKEKYNLVNTGMNLKKNGPPAGSALTLQIFSDNFKEVSEFVQKAEAIAEEIPNVTGVHNSLGSSKEEVHVVIDEDKAAAMGVTLEDTATTIRIAFKGSKASVSNNLYRDSVDILVKFEDKINEADSKENIDAILSQLEVKNSHGNSVKLSAFAKFEFAKGVSMIRHRDRKAVVTINGELANGEDRFYTTDKVNAIFEEKINELKKNYPNIVTSRGGTQETNKELAESVGMALFSSIVLIFFILCLLFRSYTQTLIIMSVIPLGIVAIAIGLFIHYGFSFLFPVEKLYYAFSFMNMLGTVALGGVLVNNSAILISFINKLRVEGVDLRTATIMGSKSRLRPILITTLTTLIGMVPFSYGMMGGEPFLQPMGITLVWGLMIGSFITMFFVPVLYYVSEKFIEKVYTKYGLKVSLTSME